jgi:hypothetical protein
MIFLAMLNIARHHAPFCTIENAIQGSWRTQCFESIHTIIHPYTFGEKTNHITSKSLIIVHSKMKCQFFKCLGFKNAKCTFFAFSINFRTCCLYKIPIS